MLPAPCKAGSLWPGALLAVVASWAAGGGTQMCLVSSGHGHPSCGVFTAMHSREGVEEGHTAVSWAEPEETGGLGWKNGWGEAL